MPSSNLLTVVGGTGTQGLSLVNAALQDGSYKIRALTRNVTSSKAKELADRGVHIVKADVNDEASLLKAFEVSLNSLSYSQVAIDVKPARILRQFSP